MALPVREAHLGEDLEMVAHGQLGQAERLGQIARAGLPVRARLDQRKELEPRRVRHRLEGAGDPLGRVA